MDKYMRNIPGCPRDTGLFANGVVTDPISATTLTVLTAVSAAASAASSVAQGAAQKRASRAAANARIAQANAQRQQAESQAAIQRQQADRERIVAAQKERDFRKRQHAAAAAVRAAAGARGIDISTGSPLLSAMDFASETEVQARRVREGGLISATRLEQQASLLQFSGRSAQIVGNADAGAIRAKGNAAFTAGLFDAGSTLLGGASDALTRRARILSKE